jgi:murein L,D-transpeptidase YafK
METMLEKQAHAPERKGRTAGRLLAAMLLAICASACTHRPPTDLPAPKSEAVTPVLAAQPEVQMRQTVVAEEGLHIVVSKAERRLTVYRDGRVLDSYPIGLGFQPRGRKRWEGDGRTPEGQYAIAMKNPHSKYYLSLGLNYPTPLDASQGYQEGRITWEQYRAIKLAFAEGRVPPWNTRLGGEIFIHGHGASRDWTRGCVALEDDDMRELYSLVDVGTPVTILP